MVTQAYGTTDGGPIMVLVPPREHWNIFAFWEESGVELEPLDPQDASSLCEAVIKPNPNMRTYQAAFAIRPELTEFCTHDLFQKHETEPGLWKYKGRADDVIVLSTGYKILTTTLENLSRNVPNVIGALVFGSARTRHGLIVELHNIGKETKTVKELWSQVEKLNENTPDHSRLQRHMILVASPNKPFARVGKGTVAKRQR